MKKLLADLANGYNLDDIKLLGIQLGIACITAFILAWFMRMRKPGSVLLSQSVLITAAVTFLVALSKNSVPLALLTIPVALLISSFSVEKNRHYVVFLILGFGCGSGNVIVTLIGMIFIFLPFLFLLNAKGENGQDQ